MTGRVPLAGRTLIVGPSGAGKTRLTARTLERWLDRHGPEGVVVLEFGPDVERDGEVLGGRLSRFTAVPAGAWVGTLEAHAPRSQGGDEADAVALARDNAVRAARLIEGTPRDPRAVFVNDATIPFQHEAGEPDALLEYCGAAEAAVLNAYAGGALGTDGPVSRRESAVLERLRAWADRTVELSGDRTA
ncbi:MAG: hypothetical protein ABEI39_00980 [Halobacteriales archaeon]